MTGPLMILAVLSLVGGWLGIPPLIGHVLGHVPNVLEHFLEPVFEHSQEIVAAAAAAQHHAHAVEWALMGLSVVIALCGIYGAYHVYMRKFPALPARLAETYSLHYNLVYNKYFVDEIYYLLVVSPIYHFSIFLWKVVDAFVIDGLGINGQAWLVQKGSAATRGLQTGYLQTYGAFMLLGLVSIIWYFLCVQ